MRDVKYRGKSVRTGEWVYGYYCFGNRKVSGEKQHEIMRVNIAGCWGTEVDPDTVGQFTGAKDKDEVDVYEGDLLEYKDSFGTRVGVVLWDEKMCTYAVEFKSTKTRLYCWTDIYMTAVVCGNIHDNPEMLKGTDNET